MDRWGRGGAEEENCREKRGKRREVGHKGVGKWGSEEAGHKGGKSERASIRGQEGRRWQGKGRKGLRYDPGITSVMSLAGGCLTKKNAQECMAVLTRCPIVFFCFFHILLLFVSFFTTFVTYFLLLKG